jgi:hypothetical protein
MNWEIFLASFVGYRIEVVFLLGLVGDRNSKCHPEGVKGKRVKDVFKT